jgi:hypothetical protein
MPGGKRAVARLGVTLLVLGTGALALDMLRPQCERTFSRVLPKVVGIFSEDAGEAMFRRLRTVVSDRPVLLIAAANPEKFEIPGGSVDKLWNNVQAGVFTAIPPLGAVLIARPYWYSDSETFFGDALSANAGPERWGTSTHAGTTFLLLQLGGGVEGLQLQVLLEETGVATVWLLDFEADHDWLPEPVILAVDPEVTGRAFDLAREVGLPAVSEAWWTCGALDGGVNSFVMVERQKVGRLSYLNSLRPAEELVSLKEELLHALGIAATGPWFQWRDG